MGSTKDLILLGNPDEGKGRGQERQTDGQEPVAPQQQPAPQLAEQGAVPGETKADTEERLSAEANNIHVGEQPVMSYQKLYGLLNPQPTQEELEKRRKKEKREKLFASIGDGLNALSSIVNLYYTTKGAPDMYKPKESLSDKEHDRWERLHKEFDAKGKEYAAGMERARRLDDEAANDRKKWKLYFAKEKAARDAQAAALKRQTAKDAADKQYKADMVQLGKDKLEVTKKHNRNMEKIAAQNAQSNRIRAYKSGSGRGGSGDKEFVAYTKDGKALYFKNAKAAEQRARQEGTWKEETATIKNMKSDGFTTTTTVSEKQYGGRSEKPLTEKEKEQAKKSRHAGLHAPKRSN